MYKTLKEESILLIGERNPNRINFLQMFDTEKIRENNKEENLRYYLGEIATYILEKKNPSGTARKFLNDWKILYYEIKSRTGGKNSIFALFTKEKNVNTKIKQAMESVVLRGGLYSAKRFFEELMDLLEGKSQMDDSASMSISKALEELEKIDFNNMDVNYIGNLISYIQYHIELDNETLEKIYFIAYEMLNYLGSMGSITEDIDLGLDGAYTVAEIYFDREVFHLALELYKRLLPLSLSNERYSLYIAGNLRIAQIYEKYFPESEDNIIELLGSINEQELENSNQSLREHYYSMLGEVYDRIKYHNKAEKYYLQAIKQAEVNISEPLWIAKAYAYLGRRARQNLLPAEASRNFLTAAALSFSGGNLVISDQYRNFAAYEELILAHWEIISSLTFRMENDQDSAIFKAWNALRMLLRAYEHSDRKDRYILVNLTTEVIDKAEKVLVIPGSIRKNRKVIRKIRKLIENLQFQKYKIDTEKEQISTMVFDIEKNIPEPPPTFLLITNDGRMILSGIIDNNAWNDARNLEGVIFSGILSAIMSLLSEVADSSLKTIDAGNFKILVERSNIGICVLLVDRELRYHRETLKNIMHTIINDKSLSNRIVMWNGRHDFVRQIKDYVINAFQE